MHTPWFAGVPGIAVPDGLGFVVSATRSLISASLRTSPLKDELGVGLTHFPPLLCGQELLLVEHLVSLPDVVDRPSELVRQHRQRLPLAVLPLERP